MKVPSFRNGWSWAVLIGSYLFFSLVFADPGMSQKVPKKTPELLGRGKALYEKACTFCHGSNGDGKGALSTNLKTPPEDFTKPLNQWKNTKGDPKKIFDTISNGAGYGHGQVPLPG